MKLIKKSLELKTSCFFDSGVSAIDWEVAMEIDRSIVDACSDVGRAIILAVLEKADIYVIN